MSRYEKDNSIDLNAQTNKAETSDEIHEYNRCEICDRIFVNKDQWTGKNKINHKIV